MNKVPTILQLVAFFVLFIATDSVGQIADSSVLIPKPRTSISPIKRDSSILITTKNSVTNRVSKTVFNNLNEIVPIKNFSGAKSLLKQFELPVDLKSPVLTMGKTNLSSQFNNSSTGSDNMRPIPYQSLAGSTSISVWNIPFSFGYNSNSGFQNSSGRLDFLMTEFDKEKFLEQMKERLTKIAKPEDLFKDALKKVYAKRDQAFNTMKAELTDVLKTGNSKLVEGLQDKINIENISGLGVDQFLNNIVNQNVAKIELKEKELVQIQSNNELRDSANKVALEIETLRSSKGQIETKIGLLKNKWFKNGILQTIGSFEKDKQSTLKRLMNDPTEVAKIASEKLKLPFLQKMLLNAKSLNVGSSGVDQSKLGINDALLKGINLEYLKGNQFFAPVLGVMPGIKNLTDLSYANFSELPDIRTTAIRMGKGDLQNDFSHISVSLFQPTNNNRQLLSNDFQSALPKNLVTTFSKKMSFGNSQTLLAEFSKSTMMYNAIPGENGDGLKDVLNSGNFFGNMGLNLDYGGDYENLGIINRIAIRYTGKEYNNLGDYSLASGTKELSNDLKKYFLKRKLIVNVKAHYREYEFSVDGRKWKSFSYTTDAKWKLKKGEFIEIRYQPYFNRRVSKEESYLSSKSYRIALRGNVNRKVRKGFTYRNFLELTSSNDSFYDPYQDKFISNGFISFTSLQTLNIGQQTLFFNTTANHARKNTNYLYGNSSLAIDGGMTFSATRNISMSSALAYNEVSKMYGQLSLRQSISAVLGKKIVLDGYLNAGKNMYELPGLHIPAITGNLSISYQLK